MYDTVTYKPAAKCRYALTADKALMAWRVWRYISGSLTPVFLIHQVWGDDPVEGWCACGDTTPHLHDNDAVIGIYSTTFKEAYSLLSQLKGNDFRIGPIHIWGRVWEWPEGYVSQFAQIVDRRLLVRPDRADYYDKMLSKGKFDLGAEVARLGS